MGQKSAVIGKLNEDRAAAYLSGRGYTLLGRNFRAARGELDIIAEKDGTIYFVEVKARKAGSLVSPYEAVTTDKQRRLLAAAEAWLAKYRRPDAPCSFLLAAIENLPSGEAKIELIEDFLCW